MAFHLYVFPSMHIASTPCLVSHRPVIADDTVSKLLENSLDHIELSPARPCAVRTAASDLRSTRSADARDVEPLLDVKQRAARAAVTERPEPVIGHRL